MPEGSKFTDGVGTGAFVLESFEPGVRTRTKRNPNDYRSDRGYVDTTETLAISDTNARLNALLSGAVHLISKLDPSLVTQIERNPKTQVFNIAGNGYCVYAMFCDTPPYDSADVRLALKYAIDREAMAEALTNGSGRATWQMWSPQSPFYVPELENAYPYDPAKAKALLAEAGYKDGFEVTDLLLNKDRKSTRLNSSHVSESRMPSSA